MRRRRVLTGLALLPASAVPGFAQISLFPIPRELLLPIAFSWSGSIEGATQALAARLGYSASVRTASGLAIPRPAPSVNVSVDFAAALPADVVMELNRQIQNRAVVVLDPERHEIGVVYFHAWPQRPPHPVRIGCP